MATTRLGYLYMVLFVGACYISSAVPSVVAKLLNLLPSKDDDIFLTTPRMLKKYGYPVEIHHVTTSDGYILQMHRLPYGAKSPASADKPVVLVVHGMLATSADWVIMGPNKGLAYILADLGYDVWLGNSRGNTYSRRHVTLNPDDVHGPFWNYSWHDMGMHDLPAEIDYIVNYTGRPKMFYIGYSQGTTQFYVLASERPEYNDKIRAMFSLAPVAYMSHMVNPLVQYFVHADAAVGGIPHKLLGYREMARHSDLLNIPVYEVCRDKAPSQIICANLLFILCGYDSAQLNTTTIPLIFTHTPAGGSTKHLFHYAQGVISGKFRKYDYGRVGNLAAYGTETPPDYNLSKITCPVALHYSSNDWNAAPVDVDQLYSELGNPIGKFLVPFAAFNHVDFLWAIDVKKLLYDQMTSLMKGY